VTPSTGDAGLDSGLDSGIGAIVGGGATPARESAERRLGFAMPESATPESAPPESAPSESVSADAVTRRAFLGAGALIAGAWIAPDAAMAGAPAAVGPGDVEAGARPTPDGVCVGPLVGHVGAREARIWLRPGAGNRGVPWRCSVSSPVGSLVRTVEASPDPDHDWTAVFDLEGLRPGTSHRVVLEPILLAENPGTVSAESRHEAVFTTAPETNSARVVLGLGSCAPSVPDPIWTQVVDEGCEGFVLLGDTPYIDDDRLSVAREKHRAFLAQPEIARMVRSMPVWGTWDDHDFGRNDGHGDFPGKHVARLAFTEYRANASFGQDRDGRLQRERFGEARGIHTSFRRGPVEVFLLDPRWFSRTAPSWADPSQPTCLGAAQWAWLREALRASTATFKLLATGMIWDDKGNPEKDDWHTYRHERDAILDFVRDERIAGVVLIGGDIHVSRALRYRDRVGYDLWQFITSPMHGSTIPSLDVPHPDLVHHAVEPHVFLRLAVDGTVEDPSLEAEWIGREGRRIFSVSLRASALAPR
jgi:phosphodiesterase/alkaline phosphatase D-like protein